jgi:hypothetical protein
MVSTLEAVDSGSVVAVESRVDRADPLPADWDPDATTLSEAPLEATR